MRPFLLSLLAASGLFAQNSHPRLILSPTMISELRVKACIGQPGGCVVDADYTAIKTDADTLKTYPPQALHVTGISNANPAVVTVTEDIAVNGWAGGVGSTVSVFMGGLPAGNWSALNTVGSVSLGAGTKISAHTFSIAVNTTSFGAYPGGAVLFYNNATANNMLYYDYEGLGWSSWFKELGLMYQITGDTSYSTQALALLDYINSVSAAGIIAPFSIDQGFPARGAVLGVATAFDWFYPLLSSAQKTATVATLNYWYSFFQTHLNDGVLYETHGLATGNYWGGYILGFGAAGLATLGDNSTAATINTFVRGQMDTYMAQALASPSAGSYPDSSDLCPYSGGSATCGGSYAGGGQAEGYGYGINHMTRMMEYIADVNGTTNEDMFSTTAYAANMVHAFSTNMLYSMFPNGWQAPNVGESFEVGPMYLNFAAQIAYYRQGQPESGWMQYFIAHAGTPPAGLNSFLTMQGALSQIPFEHFLYTRSAITPVDYTATQNPYYFSDGDGELIWRSNWTGSATKLTFTAAPTFPAGHHIRNAGGITLARGSDYIIVNAGHYQGTAGDTTSSGSSPDTIASDDSPVLHFDDGGAYMYGYQTQQNWGTWIAPLYKFAPTYAYGQNDFTAAYDDKPGSGKDPTLRALQYEFRSVGQVGNCTFVYDRVGALASGYVKKIYWPISPITTAIPTVSANVASAVVGSSKVYITPVLPASPSTALVQVPGGSPYRFQIADSATNTTTSFLTVIYTGSSGASLPTNALLSSSTNAVAVQVADTTPAVFVHANVITQAPANVYTATAQASVSFTSTHAGSGNYLVGGLASGTYAITGGSGGSCAVGIDGTCYFTSVAGSIAIAVRTPQPPTLSINGRAVLGGTIR